MPNKTPDYHWQVVSTDFITGIPPSQGYDSIWVVVDRLSKQAHFVPTHSTINAMGLARLFREHVWKLHGLPEEVISDRVPQFVAKSTKELNQLLGINSSLSSAYHPQSDGQTERINQVLKQYLHIFSNQWQDDWAEWLSVAEFAHNNHINSTTKKAPFEVIYGGLSRLGTESPATTSKLVEVENIREVMKDIVEETRSALKLASDDMARFYNRLVKDAPELEVGGKVWLDARNIKTKKPSKKLDCKWYGPFTINKKISQNAYKLQLPQSFKSVHPVFHISLLRPFEVDTIPERPYPTLPDPAIDN